MMTSEDFRRHGHQAIDWIADYLDHAERYPVLSRVHPGDLTDALPATGPERGESMDLIMSDFERLIVPAAQSAWAEKPLYFAVQVAPSAQPQPNAFANVAAVAVVLLTSPCSI